MNSPSDRVCAPSEASSKDFSQCALLAAQRTVVAQYHEASFTIRDAPTAHAPRQQTEPRPSPWKSYPPELARVKLPAPRGRYGARLVSQLIISAAPPEPPSAAWPAEPSDAVFELYDVSQLLHGGAGITEQSASKALRAAPSSGATFAPELYVVVNNVQGLNPGLYYYCPRQHELVELVRGPVTPGALGLAQDAWPVRVPLVVLTSVVFDRGAWRFGLRAYRYMMADVGHVVENLRLVAAELGWFSTLLPAFEEAQAQRLLQVDPSQEGVVAVLVLHHGGVLELTPSYFGFADVPMGDFSSAVNGVVRMYQASSLVRTDGAVGDWQRAVACVAATDGEPADQRASGIPLAPMQPTGMDVWQTLRTRRTERLFTPEPLTEGEFASALRAMAGFGPVVSPDVEPWVLVNRVRGLDAGLYRYDASAQRLVLARPEALGEAAASALRGQKMVANGAALLIAAIRVAGVLHKGARAYRHAWIEAGMMCQRVYVDTWARGLGACAIGAYYDIEAAQVFGFGQDLWPGEQMIIGNV